MHLLVEHQVLIKSKVLELNKTEVLTTYKDSVSSSYNSKISQLELNIESKDKEQTEEVSMPTDNKEAE
jgi:hypothetical protein